MEDILELKRNGLLLFTILILVISCSYNQESYGTIALHFGSAGHARAIDPGNGLPYLHDTTLTITVRSLTRGTIEKTFAPDEEKSLLLTMPVGEKITIRVKAATVSAFWTGSAEHTVTAGINTVNMRLNKQAAGLQNLFFSMTEDGRFGPPNNNIRYRFVLSAGTKVIAEKHVLSLPRWCRDNKGRLYLAYSYDEGNSAIHIVRYDAEGMHEQSADNSTFFPFPPLPTPHFPEYLPGLLTSDLVTGNVYYLDSNHVLKKVDADSTPPVHTTYTGMSSFNTINCIAAHDGQLFVLGLTSTDTHKCLYIYDIDDATHSLMNETKHTVKNKDGSLVSRVENYTDMLVKDGAVYFLWKKQLLPGVAAGAPFYSKGKLVKCAYNKADKTIGPPQEFGETAEPQQGDILPTPETCFFGPLRFIGFEDDMLYIADDGIKIENRGGTARVTANKNRIGAFNTATDQLFFSAADVIWEKDEPLP